MNKEKGLSKTNTIAIKGILAVLIIIHHIYQRTTALKGIPVVSFCLANLGFLCVSLFFFFSGYGLIISWQKKGTEYVKGLFFKKVLPLYILCILCSIINQLILFPIDQFTFTKFLSFFYVFGSNYYFWYFEIIIVFYILFICIFLLKIPNVIKLVSLVCLNIGYIVLASFFLPDYWFISVIGISIGLLWGWYKQKIDICFSKKLIYYVTFSVTLVLFIALFFIRYAFQNINTNLSNTLIIINNCFFVGFVVCLSYKVNFNNVITRFLGNISLELYMFQYLIMDLYRCGTINIKQDWLYTILTFATILIFSFLIHFLIKLYMRLFEKLNDKIMKNNKNEIGV